MANIKSKEKRNRQSEKRNIRNTQSKSSIRTARKKFLSALSDKEINIESVKALLVSVTSKIDTAAGKKIIKKNAAARYKSRLAKRANAL